MAELKKFGTIGIQKGEGCDYTIGCGIRFTVFEAKDLFDAIRIVTEEDEEASIKFYASSERKLQSCIVFPMDEAREVLSIYQNHIAAEKAAQAKKDEELKLTQDEAEFERLKKKLGR